MSAYETVAELEHACRELSDDGEFHALYGTPGHPEWSTYTRNVDALRRLSLRPRVLVDVSEPGLATTVLGQEISLPVMIAPVGSMDPKDPNGDVAAARAAFASGTIPVLSAVSRADVADVGQVAPGYWQQVFFLRDRAGTRRKFEAAAEAGCAAFVWTVSNTGAQMSPTKVPPRWRGAGGGGADPWDNSIGWSDVAWLRSLTDKPIVLKGVQTGADALLAAEHGIEAVVVSNHGGRTVPDARGTTEALEEVVDAVAGRIEVFVDGGFTQGHDVLKALAIGARTILIGRAACWGLRVDGYDGVARVLEILRRELAAAMGWCGIADVRAADRSLLS